MTTIAMTSRLYHSVSHIGNICSSSTYHVTVECEDNEFYYFEVDADSYGEACTIADSMAQDMYINIRFILVEQIA
ncbi:MAG: hypothetical protein IJK45_01280 [Bacteroidaceae bacterium]|nr:hypothetical protein [Bacteroidaceae bacterium]